MRVAPLLLSIALGLGCRGPRPTSMEVAGCKQEIEHVFGSKETIVVAAAAADGGSLFRPDTLAAVDRVCAAFEAAAVDDEVPIKCLTTLPIMSARPTAARITVVRDELPIDEALAQQVKTWLGQIEFSRGDVVDASGDGVTFIHLPRKAFEGVDVFELYRDLVAREVLELVLVIDSGRDEERGPYRRLAPDGPSSSVLVGLVDTGEPGGLKEPSQLLALQAFQNAAESMPKVAQSFTLVDDIIMARRGLKRGNPAEAILPARRAEVGQILLALSMSPMAGALGSRSDSEHRVGLIRIQLEPMGPEPEQRVLKRLDGMLQSALPPGTRAFLCPEY